MQRGRVELLDCVDQVLVVFGKELSGDGGHANGAGDAALVGGVANAGVGRGRQHLLEEVLVGGLEQGAVDDAGGRVAGQTRAPALGRGAGGLDALGLLLKLLGPRQRIRIRPRLEHVRVGGAAGRRVGDEGGNALCRACRLVQARDNVLARGAGDVLVGVVLGVGSLHGHCMRPRPLRGEQQQVESPAVALARPAVSTHPARADILDVGANVARRHGRLCSVF